MTATVTCNRCGHERQVGTDEIRRGIWKDRCPLCRPDDCEDAPMRDLSTGRQEGRSVPSCERDEV